MLRRALATARPVPVVVAPGIRAISPSDGFELQQFIRALSPESRYSRFMMAMRELPEATLARFLRPDPESEAVLVATSPACDIIGLAQYVADPGGDGCEVSLVVSDAWHRRGVGTALLTILADVAIQSGIGHFHADVLADNYRMRGLARKVGCEVNANPEAHFLVRIRKTLESPAIAAVSGYHQ